MQSGKLGPVVIREPLPTGAEPKQDESLETKTTKLIAAANELAQTLGESEPLQELIANANNLLTCLKKGKGSLETDEKTFNELKNTYDDLNPKTQQSAEPSRPPGHAPLHGVKAAAIASAANCFPDITTSPDPTAKPYSEIDTPFSNPGFDFEIPPPLPGSPELDLLIDAVYTEEIQSIPAEHSLIKSAGLNTIAEYRQDYARYVDQKTGQGNFDCLSVNGDVNKAFNSAEKTITNSHDNLITIQTALEALKEILMALLPDIQLTPIQLPTATPSQPIPIPVASLRRQPDPQNPFGFDYRAEEA